MANKIRKLRQLLRGWVKMEICGGLLRNLIKKRKNKTSGLLRNLKKKAETQILSQQEIDLKQSVKQRISQLLREE